MFVTKVTSNSIKFCKHIKEVIGQGEMVCQFTSDELSKEIACKNYSTTHVKSKYDFR